MLGTFVLTIYETKMSFLTSLIRSTVSLIELVLAPHFYFLHALTTGMCHMPSSKSMPLYTRGPLFQGFQVFLRTVFLSGV